MNDDQLILKWLTAARACIGQHDDGGQTVLHIRAEDVVQLCLAALRSLPMDSPIRVKIDTLLKSTSKQPGQQGSEG